MRFPTPDQAKGLLGNQGAPSSTEEIGEELRRATRVVELMTGHHLRPQTHQEEVLFVGKPELLSEYPVRNVHLNGLDTDHEERTGRVYTNLPPGNYHLTYETGCPTPDVPALAMQAILHTMQNRLTGSEEARAQAAAEIQVMRAERQALVREREREAT
jgi:hypothetical protein